MRKKILSMSIAAVMTAMTSSGVMAFDTNGFDNSNTDGPIRAPEVTASYEDILKNRLKNDIPNITDAQITAKIATIKNLEKLAGYQGNLLPLSAPLLANMDDNLHPPVQSIANLTLSSDNLGDALIFPMFNQADDWGTEIVVRNTDQKHAIVAKVAVYAADKSEEVLDFNVYLSAADVVRFKIENGQLMSTDGSVLRIAPTPSSEIDDISRSDFATKAKPFTHKLSIESGYVVVYGMAQASTDGDLSDHHSMSYHKHHKLLFKHYRAELDACRPGWRNGHQNAMVNGTYTRHTRSSQSIPNYSVPAPNQATNCNFKNTDEINDVIAEATEAARLASQIADNATAGAASNKIADMLTAVTALVASNPGNSELSKVEKMLKIASAAMAQAAVVQGADILTKEELASIASTINKIAQQVATAVDSTASAATNSEPGNFFGDVSPSLTGTVRLYVETNGARDMILPATAIENFTSGNKIIYSEGEIAALQDRKIQGIESQEDLGWAKYNELGIRADARAFVVNNLSYNFAEASTANQLVITQPYKRVLVQLGNDDRYWQDADVGIDTNHHYWESSDDNYGGYTFLYNVYDEHENIDPAAYTESPHNSGIVILRKELEKMANLEDASTETFFTNRQELGENADKNGFALLSFTNMDGLKSGIPAIVTQMIGTTVGNPAIPQTNWIYSQTKR